MAEEGLNPTGVEDALINPEVVVEVEVEVEAGAGRLPLETGMMEMTSAWIWDRGGHLNPTHPEVQELAEEVTEVTEGEEELKDLPENTRSSRRERDSDQNMCNCLYRRFT